MTATTTDIRVPEGYILACAVSDVPARGKHTVTIHDRRILIITCEDGCHAVEDACPHTGRSITHSKVLNCQLTTPTNGARYCLRTGRYLGGGQFPLPSHSLAIWPLQIVGDCIYVRPPGT